MVECGAAACEQHQKSQISGGTALHALIYEIGLISTAAQIRLPAAFAITFVRTLRYLSEAIQGRADGPGVLTRRHCISEAVQMKVALHIMVELLRSLSKSSYSFSMSQKWQPCSLLPDLCCYHRALPPLLKRF